MQFTGNFCFPAQGIQCKARKHWTGTGLWLPPLRLRGVGPRQAIHPSLALCTVYGKKKWIPNQYGHYRNV